MTKKIFLSPKTAFSLINGSLTIFSNLCFVDLLDFRHSLMLVSELSQPFWSGQYLAGLPTSRDREIALVKRLFSGGQFFLSRLTFYVTPSLLDVPRRCLVPIDM